jgi:hypothetical protein
VEKLVYLTCKHEMEAADTPTVCCFLTATALCPYSHKVTFVGYPVIIGMTFTEKLWEMKLLDRVIVGGDSCQFTRDG